MQSLDLIKKRIITISNTKKITNAAKLIAMTKMKSQKEKLASCSTFCQVFYDSFKQLIIGCKDLAPLTEINNKLNSNLYIVIGSDMGLCGPYNNNVCKYLLQHVAPNDKIIVFGSKCYKFLKMNECFKQIINYYPNNFKDNFYYALLPLCYKLNDAYFANKYKTIKIIYTSLITSIKYQIKDWQILPLNLSQWHIQKQDIIRNMTIYDTKPEEILKKILPIYILNVVYGALIEANVCESFSRHFAMDQATKSANEMINDLKIQYNKTRQELITQQINEIISSTIEGK